MTQGRSCEKIKSMRQIISDIEKHEFKSVYLIYGEEAYLKDQIKDRLVAALSRPDDTLNYSVFSGRSIDVKELISLADTLPFLAEKRLIVVKDSGFFKKADDTLTDYIKKVPAETVIVFVENEVDKRGKMYKAVNSAGYAAEMTTPAEAELKKWIAVQFKKEGKLVRGSTVQKLMTRVGTDMQTLKSEIDKLVSYVGSRDTIEDEDIDAICIVHMSNNVFALVNAISEGRQKAAMDLYYEMVLAKEPPMKILFLIAKEFNTLLEVKALAAQSFDNKTIAAKTGRQAWLMGKYRTLASMFTAAYLKGAIQDSIEMEEAVKSGKITDRLSVELLIIKYSKGITKNER